MDQQPWLDRLSEVLRVTSSPTPPALALVDALDEMIEWISDPRPFVKSHHARAWRSVDRDLRAAREAAGAATRRLVQAGLDAFDIEAAILVANAGASRDPHIELLTTVRSQVVSDAGLRATWADMADDLPGRTITELCHRRYSLTRSAKGRGLDALRVYQTMAGVVENRLLDVEEARVRTDPTFKPSTIPLFEKLNADAGLSVSTRIDLCADLLCTPPVVGRYVVWLGIDRATMREIQLEVNTITLWNSRFVHDTLSVPIEDRADHIPEELRDESAHQTAFPVGQFTVLARLDLGVRQGSFVEEDARRILTAVLAPSERAFTDDWKVMPGSVIFKDDQQVGWHVFETIEETPTAYRLDGIADRWLREGAQKLAAALPAPPNSELDRFMNIMEWDSAHRAGHPLTSIMLAVRTIEAIAQSHLNGMRWDDVGLAYASHMSWSRMRESLGRQAGSVLFGYDNCPDDASRGRLRQIFLDTVKSGPSGQRLDLADFVSALPELIDLWSSDPAKQSDLGRCLAIWTDAELFKTAIDLTFADISLQLDRARRLRNAAQHGGPVRDEVLRSASAAIDHLRRQLLIDMMTGLTQGRGCRSTLEGVVDYSATRRAVLDRTRSPIDAVSARWEEDPAAD